MPLATVGKINLNIGHLWCPEAQCSKIHNEVNSRTCLYIQQPHGFGLFPPHFPGMPCLQSEAALSNGTCAPLQRVLSTLPTWWPLTACGCWAFEKWLVQLRNWILKFNLNLSLKITIWPNYWNNLAHESTFSTVSFNLNTD